MSFSHPSLCRFARGKGHTVEPVPPKIACKTMCGLQYHEESYLKPPNNSFLLKPGLTLKLQTRTNKYNPPPGESRRTARHAGGRVSARPSLSPPRSIRMQQAWLPNCGAKTRQTANNSLSSPLLEEAKPSLPNHQVGRGFQW